MAHVSHVPGEGEALGTGPCASLQMILADDRHTFMMKKHCRFCKILYEVAALSLLSLTRELPSWLFGPKARPSIQRTWHVENGQNFQLLSADSKFFSWAEGGEVSVTWNAASSG